MPTETSALSYRLIRPWTRIPHPTALVGSTTPMPSHSEPWWAYREDEAMGQRRSAACGSFTSPSDSRRPFCAEALMPSAVTWL